MSIESDLAKLLYRRNALCAELKEVEREIEVFRIRTDLKGGRFPGRVHTVFFEDEDSFLYFENEQDLTTWVNDSRYPITDRPLQYPCWAHMRWQPDSNGPDFWNPLYLYECTGK